MVRLLMLQKILLLVLLMGDYMEVQLLSVRITGLIFRFPEVQRVDE